MRNHWDKAMTEHYDLIDLIRQREAQNAISRLGYFCAPFRPETGPYADRVIKVYRGLKDHAALDRLAACHEDYVAILNRADVGLPHTEFVFVDIDGQRIPVVLQEALPSETMMRTRMIEDDLEATLAHMQLAGEVIARFWNDLTPEDGRVGFHPSIRNFAIHDGRAKFFDTFPPLIHYSRAEMGKMLLTYSDKRLMRMIGPFMPTRVTGIQDEWYSPAETLVGMVGSACRLRPDDAEAYLEWGRTFTPDFMPRWAEEILPHLQEAPRLPGYWTGFRKLLGLVGEPNVK